MSRIIGIALAVIVVIVLLVWLGVFDFGTDEDAVINETQGGVGEIVDEPGTGVDVGAEEVEVVE